MWADFFVVIISLNLAGICVWIIYKLYSHRITGNDTKKQIPFMECIWSVEQYLIKNNKNVTGYDGLFFASESPYSCTTKEIILQALKACKNGEISIFGKQGVLANVPLNRDCLDKDKIVFINDLPVLINNLGVQIFTDWTIDKNEAMKWAMKKFG